MDSAIFRYHPDRQPGHEAEPEPKWTQRKARRLIRAQNALNQLHVVGEVLRTQPEVIDMAAYERDGNGSLLVKLAGGVITKRELSLWVSPFDKEKLTGTFSIEQDLWGGAVWHRIHHSHTEVGGPTDVIYRYPDYGGSLPADQLFQYGDSETLRLFCEGADHAFNYIKRLLPE